MKILVYSNTDYLDVLKIQTEYLKNKCELILFLNNNDLDLEYIYTNYNKVIFYNNNDTYPKRVYDCLSKIDDEYILFLHDIDILLDFDETVINSFYSFLKRHNYDRIDLKYSNNINNGPIIKFDIFNPSDLWENDVKLLNSNDIYLIKQNNINDYIYNVNPSIWKRQSLMDILNKFNYKNYRTIEEIDVQIYSSKYNIFKLNCNKYFLCGYFNCLKIFKFLHISHSGKFLQLNDSFTTVYNQSYKDVSFEYSEIVNKFNLRNSPKWIH